MFRVVLLERIVDQMGYINTDEYNRLKKEYKSGKRVRAIDVNNIEAGTTGIVKGVRTNGTIIVLWDLGFETGVVYGEESIAVIVDGYCLLENDMAYGGCDGDLCSSCGWNSEVAEKRLKRIFDGDMVVDRRGIMKLVIRRGRGSD